MITVNRSALGAVELVFADGKWAPLDSDKATFGDGNPWPVVFEILDTLDGSVLRTLTGGNVVVDSRALRQSQAGDCVVDAGDLLCLLLHNDVPGFEDTGRGLARAGALLSLLEGP